MDWLAIIEAIATGAVGSGLIEIIKHWSVKPTAQDSLAVDPALVTALCRDESFCLVVANLYYELGRFIEQLSVVYCELIGVSGYSEDTNFVADPGQGRSIFVPQAACLIWRNFYMSGLPAWPTLQDDTGAELRFYTVWQDSRFVATDQAIRLLMRHSDGSLKRRLQKKELVQGHYLMLSLFSLSGLLFETAVEVINVLSSCEESRMSGVMKRLAPRYAHLLTLSVES